MTMTSATSQIDQVTAGAALERARAHLLSRQHPDGWWKGALDTNVTMDAEDLLLREFLGIRGERETRMAANWIRSQQRDDGSWGLFHGADGDLSTTVEAYAALRLAGDPPEAEHMRRACAFARAAGGLERTRTFTHIWLALFGLWSWDDLPALPPEIVLLPPKAPLSIYQFGCWARQTVVALTIVMDAKPVRPLPFGLDELRVGPPPAAPHPSLRSRAGVLAALDRAARAYSRRPLRVLREHALLRGYPLDHPVMRAGIEGIETFIIEEGDQRRLEACQSPVWDTALAVIALSDAGVPADDPDLVRAADWLLDEEVTVRCDWAIRPPDVPAGGWGALDADKTSKLTADLPFCDFGEVTDPPSADVTAHAVEMLAREAHDDG